MNDTNWRTSYGWTLAAGLLGPVVLAWIAAMVSPLELEMGMAAFSLVVVVLPVTMYATTMTVSYAGRWAAARAARFGPDQNAVIAGYLARTRAARALGVTLGLGVPGMLMSAYNADHSAVAWYPDVFAQGALWSPGLGYLVASVSCELTKPRLPSPGGATAGTAALMQRRLGDFLDPLPRWALKLYGILAVGVTLVGLGVVLNSDRAFLVWSGQRFSAAATALVGLACLVAAVTLSRRREQALDEAAFAYEELTRTATVNALVGAAVAMFGSYVVVAANLLHPVSSSIVAASLGLVGFFGLVVWLTTGTGLVFRTRRLEKLRSRA